MNGPRKFDKVFGVVTVILAVLLFLGALLISPFLVIWSLNALFGLSIAVTLETWIAVQILIFFFNARIKVTLKG